MFAYRERKRPKHSSSFSFRLLQDAFNGIITSGNALNPSPPPQVHICIYACVYVGWGGGGGSPFLLRYAEFHSTHSPSALIVHPVHSPNKLDE
jgi:hypothetical protein